MWDEGLEEVHLTGELSIRAEALRSLLQLAARMLLQLQAFMQPELLDSCHLEKAI